MKPNLNRRRALALLPTCLGAGGAALLAGCGGGQDSEPGSASPPDPRRQPLGVGGEGTGRLEHAFGALQALDGLLLAGAWLDDSRARAWRSIDPRAPQPLSMSELRLGMTLRTAAEGGFATAVTVWPEVVGPVQAVDAEDGRLVVAGQRVRIDSAAAAPTVREGLRDLGDLGLGDTVEVHGWRDAQGAIAATWLARRADAPAVRVVGAVTALDAAGGWLAIDGLRVDIRSAQRLGLRSFASRGLRVVAFGTLAGPVLVAQALAAADPAPSPRLSLAAEVAQRLGPGRFVLRGTTVDAGALPAASSPDAGDLVQVRGALVDGVLRAESLVPLDDDVPPAVRISANVAGAQAGDFRLRGMAVDAQSALFSALGPANVADGVPLRVEGPLTSQGVHAMRILRLVPGDAQVFVQAGVVERVDTASGRFALEGLAEDFLLDAETVLEPPGAGPAPGRDVIVRCRRDATGVLVATRIGARPAQRVELVGLVSFVEADDPGQGEFGLGLDECVWDAHTQFVGATGSAADLRPGRVAAVVGERVGVQLRARQVDTTVPQEGSVRLRGTVTDLQPGPHFRIDGQRIDARAAAFEPAGLVLAGARVDVVGRMLDGWLVASRVSEP
jgi:hypothetical protein